MFVYGRSRARIPSEAPRYTPQERLKETLEAGILIHRQPQQALRGRENKLTHTAEVVEVEFT
jgi:hypothetical protein